MTILRYLRECLSAEVAYALALYALGARALLLYLLLSQADARSPKVLYGANPSSKLIAPPATLEPGSLQLLAAVLPGARGVRHSEEKP